MRQRSILHWFVVHHDDIPAFHAGYLVLTFLIAALLNLGVFALLIALHIAFDLFKYKSAYKCSWKETVRRSFMESIVDVALFFVALVALVYLHEGTGIIALSGLLRAEATIARGILTVLPKFAIIGHTLPAVVEPIAHQPTERMTWSSMERISVVTLILCAMLIAAATTISTDPSGLRQMLFDQLLPWRL